MDDVQEQAQDIDAFLARSRLVGIVLDEQARLLIGPCHGKRTATAMRRAKIALAVRHPSLPFSAFRHP